MENVSINKEQFIEKLNEDLASEFRSIVQYVQHVSSIKGAPYQQVLQELRKHLGQELKHAMILAVQIDFLGGTPSCRVPKITTKETPKAALTQDLRLEEKQLQRYRERIVEAKELGLPDVAEALSPLLIETQNHVNALRGVVGTAA